MTTQLLEANKKIDFERTYTLEEFLNLDLPDDYEYELVKGKLVARDKTGSSGRHAEIIGVLMQQLRNYKDDHSQGSRVFSQGPCNLGRNGPEASWVEPDVSFVVEGRFPDEFEGPIPVAPDLIAEVWSPSDTTRKIQDKIEDYLDAGVKVIWSVYLLHEYVIVTKLGEKRRILLDLKDELDGGEVLPGFKLKVNKLFDQ